MENVINAGCTNNMPIIPTFMNNDDINDNIENKTGNFFNNETNIFFFIKKFSKQ